ncbi:outer membrane transport energization protein TonB [Fodinibius salinus]|uniref:Outer membrane transport energization protein TonB n=1 Tax=Fodinibius salinus TaxID=860790 RepID=A0A5D3YKU0_9BACT|nr:energy transducer TonB [Fodinibius salinus]TYP92528.1 outer membrane transport energization protein TonB [Fodinibius salinus]
MRSDRKKPSSDLQNYYTLFLQGGMIVVLLLFVLAAKIDFVSEKPDADLTEEQEVTKMEEVVQTKQEKKPPAPPAPQVPVEVPNDEIVEDQSIDLDADMSMDEKLEMPPPPEEEEEEDFFVAVENMPELKGGLAGLQKQINYPEMARKAGIEGRVTIQFVVTEDGNVEDPKVIRGIGGGCDKEALRVVKQAEFKPGRQRGEPVRVQYSLPITFKLQN